jgi:hemerythrin-like domain-containing protein
MADHGSTSPTCPTGASATEEHDAAKPLPKLTPAEFRTYNHMAETMNYYVRIFPHDFHNPQSLSTPLSSTTQLTTRLPRQHDNFRSTWTLLHTACTNRARPAGMSLHAFLTAGLTFAHHLTLHHTIEEQHIFPVLATRMPAFREELELLTHHRRIHEGLHGFETYLEAVRGGERELRWEELLQRMDGWGAVLWEHLDAEVEELGAENMRRFWSVQEMREMPM